MERQRQISVRLSDDDLRKAAGAPSNAAVTVIGGYSDQRDPRESSGGYVTVTWVEKKGGESR
jgi:hypothetical protein